jgi:hypothetical protein
MNMLCGPLSRYGGFSKIVVLPLPGIEPSSSDVQPVVTIPTELSGLPAGSKIVRNSAVDKMGCWSRHVRPTPTPSWSWQLSWKQIWRARAESPAVCLHGDTSIGREWIRQPVMAIVSFKGAISRGGLQFGRSLINTSQAQILFALKTADYVTVCRTGDRSGKLFTCTGMVLSYACYPERFIVVFRSLKVNSDIALGYVTGLSFHALSPSPSCYPTI